MSTALPFKYDAEILKQGRAFVPTVQFFQYLPSVCVIKWVKHAQDDKDTRSVVLWFVISITASTASTICLISWKSYQRSEKTPLASSLSCYLEKMFVQFALNFQKLYTPMGSVWAFGFFGEVSAFQLFRPLGKYNHFHNLL